MKPATNSSGSSVNQGQVGLFWFYKHRLLASPIPLDQAEARGAKRDSPEAHIAVWPRMVARYKAEWPILSILDYDEVPRGRVIFDTATHTLIIYMDATLFVDAAPEHKPRVVVRDGHSARRSNCTDSESALRPIRIIALISGRSMIKPVMEIRFVMSIALRFS